MTKLEELINEGAELKSKCYQQSQFASYMTGEPYELWISKGIFYLDKYFAKHALTDKFKNAANNAVGNDLEYYEEMMGVLKALFQMQDDDKFEIATKNETNLIQDNPIIFISHASKDKDYCTKLVDLMHDIGVQTQDIFYSSLEEHGVPLGEDFLDYIRERFNNNVYVLFILSKNFYESKICLAEMGAAWVKSADYLPVLIPPTNYEDMEGVIRPTKNSMMINDDNKLDSLKTKIEELFQLEDKIDSQRWQRKKRDFIEQINSLLEKSKKNDFEVLLLEILDGESKNSRVKLELTNNTRKVIRPAEIEIRIEDMEGNLIGEVFDDYRISSLVLRPFEKVFVYLDLLLTNENFKKRRIKNCTYKNEWDYLA